MAPEDCTGCKLCVMVCPAKDKSNPKHKAINMAPAGARAANARRNYDFFLDLPDLDRANVWACGREGFAVPAAAL